MTTSELLWLLVVPAAATVVLFLMRRRHWAQRWVAVLAIAAATGFGVMQSTAHPSVSPLAISLGIAIVLTGLQVIISQPAFTTRPWRILVGGVPVYWAVLLLTASIGICFGLITP